MRTAETRYSQKQGFIEQILDPWFNNDEEFVDYEMDKVRENYWSVRGREDGDFSRYLKDAMLHVASVSYDAALEGEITLDKLKEVLDSTRNHVSNHYFGGELEPEDPVIPELDRGTGQFSYQGESTRQIIMNQLAEACEEGSLQDWYREETGDTIDRVIGISGGGIEPAIIASEALDVDMDLVRCSPKKREDESLQDIKEKRDYTGENILILDDIEEEGRAKKLAKEYAEERGAEEALFTAGVPEWDFIEYEPIEKKIMGGIIDKASSLFD